MEIKYQAHFIKLNYRLRRKLTVFYATEEQKLSGIYLNFQETESKKNISTFYNDKCKLHVKYTKENTKGQCKKGNP